VVALVGREDPKFGSDVKTDDAVLMMQKEDTKNLSLTDDSSLGGEQAGSQAGLKMAYESGKGQSALAFTVVRGLGLGGDVCFGLPSRAEGDSTRLSCQLRWVMRGRRRHGT